MNRIYVPRVNGGADSYVRRKGQSAHRTRTVLDRANVVCILVVPIVQQKYLHIKVKNYNAIYASSMISKLFRLKKKVGLFYTEMMFVGIFSGHNRRLIS